MGHEMGHYVLNHSLRLTVYMSILIIFGFWFVHTVLDRVIVRSVTATASPSAPIRLRCRSPWRY